MGPNSETGRHLTIMPMYRGVFFFSNGSLLIIRATFFVNPHFETTPIPYPFVRIINVWGGVSHLTALFDQRIIQISQIRKDWSVLNYFFLLFPPAHISFQFPWASFCSTLRLASLTISHRSPANLPNHWIGKREEAFDGVLGHPNQKRPVLLAFRRSGAAVSLATRMSEKGKPRGRGEPVVGPPRTPHMVPGWPPDYLPPVGLREHSP